MKYRMEVLRTRPRRYRHLFETIYREKSRRIVEIGVWNGAHAEEMIRTATLHHSPSQIHYYGFDLFEDLSDTDFEREFSKRPPARDEVWQRLRQTGADVHLFQGDTKVTLPDALEEIRAPDLVFIDGGHSLETVASDWSNVRRIMGPNTTVLFDDYYLNTEPEVEHLGCRSVIDNLPRDAYQVDLLRPVDTFPKPWGTLRVSMVRVRTGGATA